MGNNKSPVWKKVKKYSFFYPISQNWRLHPAIKIIVCMLLILVILLVIYIKLWCDSVRCTMINLNNSPFLSNMIGWFPEIFVLLLVVLLIVLFCVGKWKFEAEIGSKWVELQFDHFYDEYKDVKLFRYFEKEDEYIKFIFTQNDDLITTETFLYNHKMEKFLDKFQESFQKNWITCEKINDIKWVDLSERVDYKAKLWFRNMRSLIPKKKRKEHIQESYRNIFGMVVFVFWGLIAAFNKHYPQSFTYFVVAGLVTYIILTTLSILGMGSFNVTIEDNAVWFDDFHYCVLSKIKKVSYETTMKWNVELICLTIDDWNKVKTYKRPKNETVERFCNDLIDEVGKRTNMSK